ncbi:MAG TPA: hypothetical protein VFQ92_18960 [Blastocatellia bacterium]|nr:hypothetical protein [Blastocatellia bacterium]
MSITIHGNVNEDVQVATGERLTLRVKAYDPAGISKIFVQCYQFSMANTNRLKFASGELLVKQDDRFSQDSFNVEIQIPDNAALGKWGVQMIEFTNCRGYKTSFYRGQGKLDGIVFEVVSPPSKEDELLQFNGIEIAGGSSYSR